MSRVQDEAPQLTEEQREWLDQNLAEQKLRHERIGADMEKMSAERDALVDQFLVRIQERGFNYNCDALRKIPKEEIPARPDRPFKVVF
jgi:hypothetical protein